jgi:hypothetical protein
MPTLLNHYNLDSSATNTEINICYIEKDTRAHIKRFLLPWFLASPYAVGSVDILIINSVINHEFFGTGYIRWRD